MCVRLSSDLSATNRCHRVCYTVGAVVDLLRRVSIGSGARVWRAPESVLKARGPCRCTNARAAMPSRPDRRGVFVLMCLCSGLYVIYIYKFIYLCVCVYVLVFVCMYTFLRSLPFRITVGRSLSRPFTPYIPLVSQSALPILILLLLLMDFVNLLALQLNSCACMLDAMCFSTNPRSRITR